MKTINKIVSVGICACLGVTVLSGCSSRQDKEPDFSGIKEVAKLSTLECYYHNVVRYHRDADGIIFGIGNIGEKNMWFEYDGVVQMGLDIDKVQVSSPDASGVVTITIPEVEILGHPDIDQSSMTDPVESNGWFTGVSASDKKEALQQAQANLLETAQNDTSSKAQATERAKSLLEQYVKNTGKALEKTYTVKWVQAEE